MKRNIAHAIDLQLLRGGGWETAEQDKMTKGLRLAQEQDKQEEEVDWYLTGEELSCRYLWLEGIPRQCAATFFLHGHSLTLYPTGLSTVIRNNVLVLKYLMNMHLNLKQEAHGPVLTCLGLWR